LRAKRSNPSYAKQKESSAFLKKSAQKTFISRGFAPPVFGHSIVHGVEPKAHPHHPRSSADNVF
jgi:hypothetical protein